MERDVTASPERIGKKLGPPVVVCTCSHHKRVHALTRWSPGPCRSCECSAFKAEAQCRCGHGKKAHARGGCHEGDGCHEFRPKEGRP